MKKIEGDLYSHFGPIKLNIDDISFLVEEVNKFRDDESNEADRKSRVHIFIDDYELESIEEISKISTKSPKRLKISYTKLGNYFSVSVEDNHTSIYCDNSSPYSKGIFFSIESYLKSRRRRFQWTETAAIYIMPAGTFASILILIGRDDPASVITYIGLGMGLLIILSLIIFIVCIPLRKNVISLEKKQMSFFVRNKDQIGLNILAFLLGIIGTIIVQAIIR